MKPFLHFWRLGWVLLVAFPCKPAPSQQTPAPILPLRVALAQPSRVYSLADTVEVVLHNPGPKTLQVLGWTELVTNPATSRGRVLLSHNVSQDQAMVVRMATPPCLRLAPASRTQIRWSVRQVLGYSGYTPAQLVSLAKGPVLRIQFAFEDCRQSKASYSPP